MKKRKDETSKESITKKAVKGWLERNNKPTYGKWVQEGIDRAKKG